MKPTRFLFIAVALILMAGGAIWYIINDYNARQQNSGKQVVMYKNPGCQCCDKWAAHMENNGYRVEIRATDNMPAVKANSDVPYSMEACHTSMIGDYIVEGHVPAEDIDRLLAEKPDAVGIMVPGMPASSPGMNTAMGQPYEVYLVDSQGNTSVFARH